MTSAIHTAQRKISVRVAHPAQHSAKRRGELGERRERSAQGMHQNSRTRTLHTQIPPKPHQGPHQDLSAPKPTQQHHSVLTEQRNTPAAEQAHVGAERGPGGRSWSDAGAAGSPQREPRRLRASPHRARPQTARRARSVRMGAWRKRDAQAGGQLEGAEGGRSCMRGLVDPMKKLLGCAPKTLTEGPKDRFRHLSKS